MKYFVLFDKGRSTLIDAENVEDCIIQVADYTGSNSDLFLKALKGCHSPKDYVYMYNWFSYCNIDSIIVIQQTLYDRRIDK